MVSVRCLDTENLPLVNPLFDRRETDVKLQGGFARLQQFFIHRCTSLGSGLSGHSEPHPTVEKQPRSNQPWPPAAPFEPCSESSILASDSTSEPSVIYTSGILQNRSSGEREECVTLHTCQGYGSFDLDPTLLPPALPVRDGMFSSGSWPCFSLVYARHILRLKCRPTYRE